jgi:aminoglycoside phosphotransferase (APT) family kinase protein
LIPEGTLRIGRLLWRARELEARLPPGAPTLCHGDFKVEHVFVGPPGTFSVIDFDSAVAGSPALDLGKFLADLGWWHASGVLPGLGAAQRQFLRGYGVEAGSVDEMRARLYEAAILPRLALRRARLQDEDWPRHVYALVPRAAMILREVGRRSGWVASRGL